MTTERFFGNPQFLAYARLLRQLHEHIRAGTDETAEGEALREQMDGPAEHLGPEEIDCLNAISADFYTLTGPPPQRRPGSGSRDRLNGVLAARDARDFAKALDLLRQNEAYLDPAVVALFRGRIWSEAGENEIAAEFFRRAKVLAPQNRAARSSG